MRLHRLEITAFGPFADPCTVDFDALTDSGLFLVHGPTGAGKTSLLDAVCFALYAGVPGGRGSGPAAHLRSHHAAEGVAPCVVLEFTAARRRLRITRSPAWTKPSRSNPVPAKVALEELRRGRWEPVSARHDEVGDVVNDVMGMGRQQFERVVLLPQGDFAAFLRSSAEDRRKVLDRLFDVSTFGGVESWLAERRRQGAAALAERRVEIGRHTAALADLLARLPEPASPATGPTLTRPSLRTPRVCSRPSVVRTWTAAGLAVHLPTVQAHLDEAVTTALAEHEQAETRSRTATDALAEARLLQATQAKGSRARSDRAGLAAAAARLAPTRQVVADAEQAAPLRGHLAAAARAAAEQAAAATSADQLVERLRRAGLVDETSPGADHLRALHERVRAGDAPIDVVDRAREDLRRLGRRGEELTRNAQGARSCASALAAQAESAAADLDHLNGRREGLLALAASADMERVALAELVRLHRLRVAIDDGARALTAAGDAVREAVDADQTARDTLLTLRAARLDGMAAELAADLADGQPCAVCGSPEHPRPATGRHTVTAADVAEAERVSDGLTTVRAVRESALATLEGAQAERRAALGAESRDAADLAQASARATERVSLAAAASGQAAALDDELTVTAAALQSATAARDDMTGRAQAAEAALVELSRQHDDALGRLRVAASQHGATCPCSEWRVGSTSLLDGWDSGDDVDPAADATARWQQAAALGAAATAWVDAHRAAGRLLDRAVDAMVLAEQRSADLAAAEDVLRTELEAAGFLEPSVATAALVERDRLRDLTDQLRHPTTRSSGSRPPSPTPTSSRRWAPRHPTSPWPRQRPTRPLSAAKQALRRHTEAQGALDRGRRLVAELTAAITDLAPATARQELLTEVAETAAGNGSNTLRMPLSSYVLAARLERVAELANERLAVMGEGRFELRHTDDRSGNAKSGLGLEVVDLWTGQPRPTSTLSGGESFMASLALALGLADAVREEAGGVDLQTLFVDEGFGTLDDESLEQVMAVLDTLRDGGRAVGVVSHVADLRTRIPRQIKVTKTPHGSSVSLLGTDRTDVA